MAFAVLVRSKIAHGIIRRIDISAALEVPGVLTIATSNDFLDVDMYYGETILDQPFLAVDRVRYVGEPVAGIVAETEEIAEVAAGLVEVDIDPLPAFNDAAAAMKAGSNIHPDRQEDTEYSNVCRRVTFDYGDVDSALAEADYVHEATYTFPAVYHYAMEPFAGLAEWKSGRLDIWSGTQQPHKVRGDLARMFNVPLTNVRVQVPYVGGGYGSKGQAKYEPVLAALARASGRPVRLVTSIDESFHTVTRHSATVSIKTGIDSQGAIVARDSFIVYDTGAYADKGPRVAHKGAYRVSGPYDIPNTRATGLAIYSNRVPAGAFRGFSTPQVVWASESSIDEIATYLGEDPLEYRMNRLVHKGRPFLADDAPMDANLPEGLSAAAKAIGWGENDDVDCSRGVACGVKDGGGGAAISEAEVHLHRDGSIDVVVPTVELGQGSSTVLAQLAGEGLAASFDVVSVRSPDTADEKMDPGTNASRSTISVGSAVYDAAAQIYEKLCDAAQLVLGSHSGLRLSQGHVIVDNHVTMPLSELLSEARGISSNMIGSLSAIGVHDTTKGEGPLGHMTPFYEVGHAAAKVSVDRETGQIHVLDFASVADVGFAINSNNCEGQDEGAAMMGFGHTLFEELDFSNGELLNSNLIDYRVPRSKDVPLHMKTILLQNQDGPGPFGSKGVGEGGTLAVAPAVANAVSAAIGVRIRDLPLTAERVWRAIQEHELSSRA